MTAPDASPYLPERRSLRALAAAAAECRGCGLYEHATQVVFGGGPADAPLMLVGEIPGDREDLAGHAFVGPAGHELDRALEGAGIERSAAYVTNAVKHFKFVQRGKRRIHDKPSRAEVRACNPWLRAELDAVGPRAVVLLGVTAGQALLGPGFRLGPARGRPLACDLAELVTATSHPSAILRARGEEARRTMREDMARDLALVADFLRGAEPA